MDNRSSKAVHYGIAVLAVALAVLLRWAVDPWLGEKYALATIFGAVGIAVWAGGLGPAVFATAAGYVAANWLFITRGSGIFGTVDDAVAMFVYLFSCAIIVFFGERMRRAQCKSRAASAHLEQALNSARMLAWDWDPVTNELAITGNARELFGTDIATAADGLPHIHPADRARREVALRTALRQGDVYFCEYRFIRPADSRVMWIADHGDIVRDATGRAVRVTGIAADITARKEADANLRQADARKNEFLALLAHELRNPLAPIRASVNVMKLANADEKVAAAREVIDRQVSHIVRLIDDLLDIGRIDQGKIELHREVVALGTLVAHGIETAQPNIEANGHQLTVHVPSQPLYVEADAVRITQVVSNLLNNASKFTPRGGRIALAVERERDQAIIRIRDNGMGIPQDQLETIFGRFVQLDQSMERSTGGLGLGLTLVRNLVELHGGSIEAASAGIGKGSEFTVRLPLALHAPAPSVQPATSAGKSRKSRRRILVVDDNIDAADSLAMLLQMQGREVRKAYDGR